MAGVAPDYSPEAVRSSIQSSLERLGLDTIDILHCHNIEFCADMRQVRSVLATLHQPVRVESSLSKLPTGPTSIHPRKATSF
jgi:aryl-alcohol dehydrogenase-like predicted oxidoreductase